MTRQQSIWNAEAELALMGVIMPVKSEEHLKHLVGYILHTLSRDETKVDEIVDKGLNKYNSEKEAVTYISLNDTPFGTLISFVRGVDNCTELKSKDGVLAYVFNLDYPECSELGYIFIDYVRGAYRRVA